MTQATTPDIEELPDIFNTMYIGNDGTFLVMAYPKKDIWKRENLEEFVQEIRKIDPEVTGTPIQIYESSTLMRNSFRMIGLISWRLSRSRCFGFSINYSVVLHHISSTVGCALAGGNHGDFQYPSQSGKFLCHSHSDWNRCG